MKKKLILLVAVAMCISLCACNGGSNAEASGDTLIFEVQGESISGYETSEEHNNFIANDNSDENVSGNLFADTASKEDNPQDAINGRNLF